MPAKKRRTVHATHNLIKNGSSDSRCSNCKATVLLNLSVLRQPCKA